MRIQTTQRTIKTVCGKTLSYLQTTGSPAVKAHSTEGPAIVYPEHENIEPEYYLYGVKYTKTKWKEALAQTKMPVVANPIMLDY